MGSSTSSAKKDSMPPDSTPLPSSYANDDKKNSKRSTSPSTSPSPSASPDAKSLESNLAAQDALLVPSQHRQLGSGSDDPLLAALYRSLLRRVQAPATDGKLSENENLPSNFCKELLSASKMSILDAISTTAAAAAASSHHFDVVDIPAMCAEANANGTNLPCYPLLSTVATRLHEWATKGSFPFELFVIDGFQDNVNQDTLQKVYDCSSIVSQLSTKWLDISAAEPVPSEEQVDQIVDTVLDAVGARGILTLLGLQCTTGSDIHVPPDISTLLESFNTPHMRKGVATRLSVGARALCKHGHRSPDGWWGGELKGKDAHKIQVSNQKMLTLFREAVWMNLHKLPHDLLVYEIRIAEGYGARWSADGKFFRGFLEPPMEDGHEKGWRH
jgi:hypothetical protein